MQKNTLTPGRWRGLVTTSTENHIFTIVAFDQRGSYIKMLPEGTSYDAAVQIKSEVVGSLARNASAVLLDPVYGLGPAMAMPRSSGILYSLEESGYTGDSTYRRMAFFEHWNVKKIKRVGASAIKLLVYYHPDSGTLAAEIEQLVADIIARCRHHDIPLFLEPISYSLDPNVSKSSAEFARTRPDVVRETARRLGALGPDVLKLEFPSDNDFDKDTAAWVDQCRAVSEVCPVPWVLLSAGVDFDVFAQQAEIACEAGASGFLAGRAIWKECVTMSPEGRAAFLENTAAARLKRLSEIAEASARPWTDFYEPLKGSENWFESYNP